MSFKANIKKKNGIRFYHLPLIRTFVIRLNMMTAYEKAMLALHPLNSFVIMINKRMIIMKINKLAA